MHNFEVEAIYENSSCHVYMYVDENNASLLEAGFIWMLLLRVCWWK